MSLRRKIIVHTDDRIHIDDYAFGMLKTFSVDENENKGKSLTDDNVRLFTFLVALAASRAVELLSLQKYKKTAN